VKKRKIGICHFVGVHGFMNPVDPCVAFTANIDKNIAILDIHIEKILFNKRFFN